MNLMIKSFVVLAACAALSAPAAAGVTAGVSPVFGTNNYHGLKANATLDLSDSMYLSPTLSTYRNDQSSGSLYSFGLRVGYEAGPLSLGAQGSYLPKAGGYTQSTLGADVTLSLSPGGSKHGHRMAGPASESSQSFGYGLAGIDIGAAVNHITHTDDNFAAGAAGDALRRKGATRAKSITVGETDVTAFVGAKFMITELSASVMKSAYDRRLEGNGLRESPFMSLSDYGAVEAGFPDSNYNLKLKWKTLPLVRPYVSFTHTNFKLGSTSSNASEVGGNIGLQMLNLQAAYGRYTQKGYASRDYFSLGGSLNF